MNARRGGWPFDAGSGPTVARLFHRLLALVFLDAFVSLGAQIRVLVGARGLLPLAPLLVAHRAELGLANFPTHFLYLAPTDGALVATCAAGALLAGAALVGVAPRHSLGLATALYLGLATAGRTFLSFQWDNLLLECGALAVLLPRDRRARVIHLLFRLVLFKLYFESGIAKWRSPQNDWLDGSAMTFYYETAPLPARLAAWAHHLPVWWHHFESRATLFWELALPLGVFGPRRLRLVVAALLTAFQIGNAATANYGFFCYLAVALHVFLLDDEDVERAWVRVRRAVNLGNLRPRAPSPTAPPRWRARAGLAASALVAAAFVFVSLVDGLAAFAAPGTVDALAPLRARWAPFRLVGTYHLFAAITRERIEPQIETSDDGERFVAHHLRYKPGDPARAPGYVAPHQPRVDFQLWFYGLSYRRGAPLWVDNLVRRLCADPAAVQPLFPSPLPAHPVAVRLTFHQYHFASDEERRSTGQVWTRTPVGETEAIRCAALIDTARPADPDGDDD